MALVLGVNSGFVTVAPTEDPAGNNFTIDSRAWYTKDTTSATAGKITEIGWWCDNATEASNFEVGLYSDNDNPATRIHVDNTNAKGTTAGWKSVAVNWEINPSTLYWLATQVDNVPTTTHCNYTGLGGQSSRYYTRSSLPNPAGSVSTLSSSIMAIYAVWEEASEEEGGQDGPYVY